MRPQLVYRLALVAFLLAVWHVNLSESSTGCIELDHHSFDKIVKRFRYTLVKFDVAFPYGDKHEAFTALALETTGSIDDLLFALVGIKDYGEKDNADLGRRFGIPDKYPVIKLFNNASLGAFVDYPEDRPVDVESLRKFLRTNSDLYLGLPGCLKEIDDLAAQFALPSNDAGMLATIVTDAESKEHLYTSEDERKSFHVYVTLMRKIAQSDKTVMEFIKSEKDRVHKLLKEKLSDKKKADLQQRLNIMDSFKSGSRAPGKVKTDEL